MLKHLKTTGTILSRIDYKEADRIVTMLSPEFGRLSLITKGVKKTKSKLAGGIELFSESEISYIKGRGQLSTLTSARLIKHYGNILTDINRTLLGYNFLKIVNRIIEDEYGQEYFPILTLALAGLNSLDFDLAITELWFYLQILKISGHTPNLVSTQEQNYVFDLSIFKFVGASSGNYSDRHIKLLRLALNSARPQVLSVIKDLGSLTEQNVVLAKSMINYVFPSVNI